MNRPYRVQSAGPIGQNGPVGLSDSAAALKSRVMKLQQDLINVKVQKHKMQDQLNCLITLVKRAWSGDQAAAMHVSAIVGVAAPEVTNQSGGNVSPNPPINNWARLTVGLLNKEYCRIEREIEDHQKYHFMCREAYLDDHLTRGPEQVSPKRQTQSMSDLRNGSTLLAQMRQAPPSGLRRKPNRGGHLYRPANTEDAHMKWGDVLGGSAVNQDTFTEVSNGFHQKPNDHPDNKDPDKIDIDYASPQKYSVFGLFDADNKLGADGRIQRSRPPSGKQQRQGDVHRARPRSAVLLEKTERPLKFETTRPVSAQHAKRNTHSGKTHTANRNLRERRHSDSGPGFPKPHGVKLVRQNSDNNFKQGSGKTVPPLYLTETCDDDDEEDENNVQIDDGKPYSGKPAGTHNTARSEESIESVEDLQKYVDKETKKLLSVDIRRPECIDKFDDDMRKMSEMESDIKRTTYDLQKKLGISPNGIVW